MKKYVNAENITTIALVIIAVTVSVIWVIPAVGKWLAPKQAAS